MRRLIFFTLIIAALLLSLQINKPFYGYHDWNGLTYAQIAKNYLRYGSLTKLGQVTNFSPTTPDNFRYDTHYHPLLTLLLAFFLSIFGFHEWTIRIVPVLFSLSSLFLLSQLVTLWIDAETGLLATIIALFTPVFIYFGKNPVHEPLTLFFILLNTYLFSLHLHHPKKNKILKWLLVTSLISLFSGWPSYYHLFLIGFFGFRKTKNKFYLLFFTLPFLGLGLLLLHSWFLTGSFVGGGIISILKYRLSLSSSPTTPISFFEFARRFALFSRNMFTLPLLIASVLGFYFAKKLRAILLILLTGILHPVIFPNAGYIHDYLQFPALAFIAFSSAIFLKRIIPPRFLLVLGIIFSLLTFSTKLPFAVAMVNSNMSKPEYDLVTNKIKPLDPDGFLILQSSQAKLLSGVVTPFYLGKEVEFTTQESAYYQVINQQNKLVITPYDYN